VPVGWREFEATTDESIATPSTRRSSRWRNLTAGLALADGAVVLSKRHELLGFGAMISGRLPAVRSVARALDLEGERFAEEATANVGARHRSAYQLVGALPGSVAVVVSQDGGVLRLEERWPRDLLGAGVNRATTQRGGGKQKPKLGNSRPRSLGPRPRSRGPELPPRLARE
jgi:hypothetical protein